ncbi:MAG TPA: ABC transporter permease [Vicinamibacterales bacterium]|nr:ABC transporter permease [Vicinamibacterales bacterium]
MLRDLRLAVRQLLRHPGLASVAVFSVAIGIGLNTTLFSVVNAVLFRGVPIAEPGRLVEIYSSASPDLPHLTTSYPDFLDLAQGADALQGVAAHAFVRGILSAGRPSLVMGEAVTANYFDVLGVRIASGRPFLPQEGAAAGSAPVIVLSHSLWQQQFAGRERITGEAVTISGVSYTVVGVAPAAFRGTFPGVPSDFWVPVTMVESLVFSGMQSTSDQNPGATRLDRRGTRWLFVKGRLGDGRSIDEARAQIDTIFARLREEYPATNQDTHPSVLPARDVRFHPMLDGYVKAASAGLLAAVGLVLLIACANVANLLLARGTARRRELAIRTAIGAGRLTLVRQLLAEALVLAGAGGALGLVIAWSAGHALMALGADVFPIPVSFDFSIDLVVLTFALVASLATAVVFGLLPAMSASKPELVPALKDHVQGDRRSRFGVRDALVVGQLAMSLMLLVCGALLARGLVTARNVDLGFDPRVIASLSFNLQMNGYDLDRAAAMRERAIEAIGAVPGVTAVSTTTRLPLAPDINVTGVIVPGYHTGPDDDTTVDVVSIGAGYLDAAGVPILQGRAISASDVAQQRRVAVVNETMARRLWPAGNAVGGRVYTEGLSSEPYEVIGIARDHKVRSVGEDPQPYLHLPAGPSRAIGLLVRTAGPAEALLPSLRQAVWALEPDVVFTEDVAASAIAATTMAPTEIGAMVVGAFGLVALVLATIGLYGVIAYSVSRRTREVGIRMAIGATRGQVLWLILSQGTGLALAGTIVGGIGAVFAGRLLQSLLYGVSATDPLAFGVAAAILFGVALVANGIPARAATRVDPLLALRAE